MKTIIQKQIAVARILNYEVTGRYYNSQKRFKNTYNNLQHACMINLWNGSVWARMDNGKRTLLKRVIN
jgi:hypothetical protein